MSKTVEDIQVMVPVPITGQMVDDLLITAFEGGSNYWIDNIRLFNQDNEQVRGHGDNPTQSLSSIVVVQQETLEEVTLFMPPSTCIERGLKFMAEKYARHFANLMIDDIDAETADVFLQCCLFQEIVYG